MLTRYHFDHPRMQADVEFCPAPNSHHCALYGELSIRIHAAGQTLLRDRKPTTGTAEPDIQMKAETWAKACFKRVLASPPDFAD